MASLRSTAKILIIVATIAVWLLSVWVLYAAWAAGRLWQPSTWGAVGSLWFVGTLLVLIVRSAWKETNQWM